MSPNTLPAASRALRSLVMVVAGAVLSGAYACRDSGRPVTGLPVVRDSAGVEIIEYESILDAPEVRFDTTPTVRIGGLQANEAAELNASHPYLSALPLSDGRFVVSDWAQLKFFDSAGTFLSAAGRRGRGPGEFTQVRRVCRLPGDSLLTFDLSDSRLNLWDSQGRLVRAAPRRGATPSDPCFSDGSFIVRRAETSATSIGNGDELTAEYVRMRIDGTVVTELGRLPTPHPEGLITRTVSIVPADDRFHVADGRTYEVRTYDLGGRLVRKLRVHLELVPLAPDKGDPDLLPRDRNTRSRDARVAAMKAEGAPPTYPAYRAVRVDPMHRLWIQDYDEERAWTVFDSAGVLLGRFVLPPPRSLLSGPELVGLDSNHVVLATRDQEGAAFLAFHRLIFPTAP